MLAVAVAALAGRGHRSRARAAVRGRARVQTLGGIATRQLRRYRVGIWRDSLRLAVASPLVGTGFGAFEDAIPRFKTVAGDLRVEHAENDYLGAPGGRRAGRWPAGGVPRARGDHGRARPHPRRAAPAQPRHSLRRARRCHGPARPQRLRLQPAHPVERALLRPARRVRARTSRPRRQRRRARAGDAPGTYATPRRRGAGGRDGPRLRHTVDGTSLRERPVPEDGRQRHGRPTLAVSRARHDRASSTTARRRHGVGRPRMAAPSRDRQPRPTRSRAGASASIRSTRPCGARRSEWPARLGSSDASPSRRASSTSSASLVEGYTEALDGYPPSIRVGLRPRRGGFRRPARRSPHPGPTRPRLGGGAHLLEYASCSEIRRLLSWRDLVGWLTQQRPDLL